LGRPAIFFTRDRYNTSVLGTSERFCGRVSLLSALLLPLVRLFLFPGATLPRRGGVVPLFPWEAQMGKKLYVGNLTYGVTDSTLEQMFAAHGTVQSAQVIMDRDTGKSKGFGFVEMGSDQEAQAAITALNGQQVEGRSLTVNEAKPREDRGGSRGGSGGSRGGYGGGSGGRRY
jgi:hypothetical protein